MAGCKSDSCTYICSLFGDSFMNDLGEEFTYICLITVESFFLLASQNDSRKLGRNMIFKKKPIYEGCFLKK